jgi:hypothetical protein
MIYFSISCRKKGSRVQLLHLQQLLSDSKGQGCIAGLDMGLSTLYTVSIGMLSLASGSLYS